MEKERIDKVINDITREVDEILCNPMRLSIYSDLHLPRWGFGFDDEYHSERAALLAAFAAKRLPDSWEWIIYEPINGDAQLIITQISRRD